ncbi:MAG TPA: sugar transferase [Balneolaceae bacterium]|nr:sugar transferase [Balneolaceae bacterium]
MQNSEVLTTGLKEKGISFEENKEKVCINRALMNINMNNIRLNRRYRRTKRFLDIIGSMFGLLVFVILYPFIAFGIKFSSRGPVMFKQERTGKNGKIFICYKFRTMHTGISKRNKDNQPIVTEVGDKRIFSFGQFLRISNIDELPQLINVFKGDMSLVGPRPLAVKECRYWRSTIPNFELRYAVKPGLTGWAQVTGYRGGNLDVKHMVYRLKRDFKYIENYCLLLDLKIIGRTFKQIIRWETFAH